MGKAIAYLVLVLFGVWMLGFTGLFDGMFKRSNLEERESFWNESVARDLPPGSAKVAVDAILATHGMALECFHSSIAPPVAECLADDPGSSGGTSGHPVALQLRFTFRSERLEKFETNPHVLR